LTEIQLIEAVKEDNRMAFRELIESYSDFAFSVAFRILNNADDAKDIVQETFIKVWEKRFSLQNNGSFKWWLRKIIVNKCYDQLRKRKRQPWTFENETHSMITTVLSDEDSQAKLEAFELAAILSTLTNKLSPRQKMVFVLAEIEGMSHDEVADITGMKKKAIKSNLHHARKKIGIMIKKYL